MDAYGRRGPQCKYRVTGVEAGNNLHFGGLDCILWSVSPAQCPAALRAYWIGFLVKQEEVRQNGKSNGQAVGGLYNKRVAPESFTNAARKRKPKKFLLRFAGAPGRRLKGVGANESF